ncbi:MAG TPA: hypothetical protein VLC55_00660 [Burkholderiales bacterium]|nr:hypothetical protein [Burkholderiales bacterium]
MSVRALFAKLFGAGDEAPGGEDLPERIRAAIPETVDFIVDTIDPRLRLVPDYQEKLGAGVARTVKYLRSLVPEPPPPIDLSKKAWSADARLNAFFAAAADVPLVMGRSKELRGFFDDLANAGIEEAVALLAMELREQNVLGVAMEGGQLKHDVAQTTVSFADHRIVMPAASHADMRFELGKRILRGLTQIALKRIETIQARQQDLEETRGRLATKLRVLRGRPAGLESLAEDPDTHKSEIEALEQQLEQAKADLGGAKASLATLDGYMEQINEVLNNPERHVRLELLQLRLNRMGIKVAEGSQEPASDLELARVSVGPDLTRVVAAVKCARDDMPPREDLLAQAERYL